MTDCRQCDGSGGHPVIVCGMCFGRGKVRRPHPRLWILAVAFLCALATVAAVSP